MKSPLDGADWLILDSVTSTQDVAAKELLTAGGHGVVLAIDQLKGRGRLRREWVSTPGDSLTMSLIMRGYVDAERPHLVGMGVALAAAVSLHCRLHWPNDLVENGRKLGGVLTELMPDLHGRLVPVVGVGINLNQTSFPSEIADRAISMAMARGHAFMAKEVAADIVGRLGGIPEPTNWSQLAPIWALFDATPGKAYRLPSGEVATAIAIGHDGELLASLKGEPITVLAADAVLGPQVG